jgi:hypothetical protein
MTIPYPTFIVLGVTVGLLGAGYVFASQPSATALPTAPAPKAAAVAPAAPTAKPPSTLMANRAPVPLATRTHDTYYTPKEAAPAVQTDSATAGLSSGRTTDVSTASLIVGAGIDGGLPPAPGDAKSGDSAQAKAAVELDGYKNVRGLEKGPDGIWRGRAMRGRTEIAIRVDATGSVSAD